MCAWRFTKQEHICYRLRPHSNPGDYQLHFVDGESEGLRIAMICSRSSHQQEEGLKLWGSKSQVFSFELLWAPGEPSAGWEGGLHPSDFFPLTDEADSGSSCGPGTVEGKWAGGRNSWLLNPSITQQV